MMIMSDPPLLTLSLDDALESLSPLEDSTLEMIFIYLLVCEESFMMALKQIIDLTEL